MHKEVHIAKLYFKYVAVEKFWMRLGFLTCCNNIENMFKGVIVKGALVIGSTTQPRVRV